MPRTEQNVIHQYHFYPLIQKQVQYSTRSEIIPSTSSMDLIRGWNSGVAGSCWEVVQCHLFGPELEGLVTAGFGLKIFSTCQMFSMIWREALSRLLNFSIVFQFSAALSLEFQFHKSGISWPATQTGNLCSKSQRIVVANKQKLCTYFLVVIVVLLRKRWLASKRQRPLLWAQKRPLPCLRLWMDGNPHGWLARKLMRTTCITYI